MKSLNEELEEIIDKHIKNPPKPSDNIRHIVKGCISDFGGAEKAVAINLIAMANLLKHLAELCNKQEDETSFSMILSDPVIKTILPFAYLSLTCKRFE
jgi:hypothetical protein